MPYTLKPIYETRWQIGFRLQGEITVRDGMTPYLYTGKAIPPGVFPTTAKEGRKSKKRLPDYARIDAIESCSQRFKEIIESFEPGVHQFIEVKLLYSDGSERPEQRYLINVLNCVDAFDEKSPDIKWRVNPGTGTPLPNSENIHKMTFLSSRIGGRHLWRGDKYFRIDVFVSNELGDALKAAKMTGVDLKPIKQE